MAPAGKNNAGLQNRIAAAAAVGLGPNANWAEIQAAQRAQAARPAATATPAPASPSSSQQQQQITQLQAQVAAANKAASDAEKARLAQQAAEQKQTLIRDYDQSARTQQQRSFGNAQNKLSEMNQRQANADAQTLQGMQQYANSAGAAAMGMGSSALNSLNFANSYEPLSKKANKFAEVNKQEDGLINQYGFAKNKNVSFGGA